MVDSEDFVPTKASAAKKDSTKDFQICSFETYKPKERKNKIKEETRVTIARTNKLNVAKVKHEIMKFGMSGFDNVKKEEAKIQLAIKLGAKPPKNKYKNYKQLLQEKKLQNEQLKTDEDLLQLGKNKMGKSTAKGKTFDKKRKKKEGLLDIYGTVKTR